MAFLNTLDEVARLIVTAELVNQDFDNDPDKVFYAKKRYDEIVQSKPCLDSLNEAFKLGKKKL